MCSFALRVPEVVLIEKVEHMSDQALEVQSAATLKCWLSYTQGGPPCKATVSSSFSKI